jgi:hypothetical protein
LQAQKFSSGRLLVRADHQAVARLRQNGDRIFSDGLRKSGPLLAGLHHNLGGHSRDAGLHGQPAQGLHRPSKVEVEPGGRQGPGKVLDREGALLHGDAAVPTPVPAFGRLRLKDLIYRLNRFKKQSEEKNIFSQVNM